MEYWSGLVLAKTLPIPVYGCCSITTIPGADSLTSLTQIDARKVPNHSLKVQGRYVDSRQRCAPERVWPRPAWCLLPLDLLTPLAGSNRPRTLWHEARQLRDASIELHDIPSLEAARSASATPPPETRRPELR